MAGQRGPVLGPGSAVAVHARQVQQHREPGGALDQGADRGTVQSEDEVALPVPRHGAVVGLGGTLADHDRWGGELLATPTSAGPWHTERTAAAQACGQLAAQRPAALHIQRLVDRLVRDPHRPIMGEVDPEPVGDLLRAPRAGPAPVLTTPVTPPDP